ncbi:MAG: anti-sigma factor RsbA family regulatory protein [Nocardioides sp.]
MTTTTTPPHERSDAGMVHEAMPARDEAQFLTWTSGYIRAALARDQPVLVALPPDRMKRVRDRLGTDASRVRFEDMCEEGRNPARIIPGLMHPFVDEHPGRRTVIVAEPMWPGRSAAAYAAWVEHEALLNLAFADAQVSILCLCDLAVLPEQTLADLVRTHSTLREGQVSRVSAGYMDPTGVLDTISALQPQTPTDAERFDFTAVSEARRVATEWGRSAGMTSDRLTDVLIAISEVSGNSVEHAGDGGTLLCWRDAGSLVYEIRDGGHIKDLLAGRLPPSPEQESGRGLLMVNLLCDLVQIKSAPSGTVIRLWMTLPTP